MKSANLLAKNKTKIPTITNTIPIQIHGIPAIGVEYLRKSAAVLSGFGIIQLRVQSPLPKNTTLNDILPVRDRNLRTTTSLNNKYFILLFTGTYQDPCIDYALLPGIFWRSLHGLDIGRTVVLIYKRNYQ